MKKGSARIFIIIGIILIVLQLLSFAGNAKAGVEIHISAATFLYDIIFLMSYFLIGIIGAVLLILGIVVYPKSNVKKMKRRKKGAYKSDVPENILAHCELTGNNAQLMKYLQNCVSDGLITSGQANELFNAYRQK